MAKRYIQDDNSADEFKSFLVSQSEQSVEFCEFFINIELAQSAEGDETLHVKENTASVPGNGVMYCYSGKQLNQKFKDILLWYDPQLAFVRMSVEP